MRSKLLIIVLSTVILSSCSTHSTSNAVSFNQSKESALLAKAELPNDFIPQNITIVSAGDSLTEGVGDSTNRGGYTHYLKDKLEEDKGINEANFYNFGVKGNRSDQLLKRLNSNKVKTAIGDADFVILTIGGNDMMKVVRENFSNLNMQAFQKQKLIYQDNLEQVVTTIREENPRSMVVLVGLYNPFLKWFANITEINQIVDDWNETSKNVLAKFPETYFVEIDDLFENNSDELLYEDYFHPNDKGYELIADRIYETLKEEALLKLPNKY
ncbi:SGNH/GDSL hydrolase family protein [Cytobacillus dafuensis]|uniref:SGNH/GDSL hydrolase family protein n=1 Tax=Cytobacillus dafuensis TaxID=1742359 RepID=A0A5B8Z5B2_CYTDA|nr:SGNH/GDSL hydrolase family protein [Cytobacillus dafuensis]QED48314.1 SGNH/GDSL hydrolase family protein [Cytobacillus dafuensis]